MNAEMFNKLLDELDGNSLETLKTKNSRYASTEDPLHNFKSGADIMGSTPAQCAWGYMTKHLVALRDKIKRDDFSDRDDLLEKCQDIINYVRFIWIIGNDIYQEETKEAEETHTCLNCDYNDDYSPDCACFSCDDDYSEWTPMTNNTEQEEK